MRNTLIILLILAFSTVAQAGLDQAGDVSQEPVENQANGNRETAVASPLGRFFEKSPNYVESENGNRRLYEEKRAEGDTSSPAVSPASGKEGVEI